MLKDDFSRYDYLNVLRKIASDKGTEVEFEHYHKDSKNLACLKHFKQGFFNLSEHQQEIVMYVLSFIACKCPNAGKNFDEMKSSKKFFEAVSDGCTDKNDRERLEGKFNRMSKCRNSTELIQFIRINLERYITHEFDGYSLIEDLNKFNYDDYHVLRNWLRDQFYNRAKNESKETA